MFEKYKIIPKVLSDGVAVWSLKKRFMLFFYTEKCIFYYRTDAEEALRHVTGETACKLGFI